MSTDESAAAVPFEFGEPVSKKFGNALGYSADEGLQTAMRVSMLLGMPLLLTGEPGCGKTSAADWLALQLHFQGHAVHDKPMVHNVKSTSSGRELLYEFDEIARFRDAQKGQEKPPHEYLALNALGLAIALTAPPEAALGESGLTYRQFIVTASRERIAENRFLSRHVVLIDELDKAPRDTPNDLLSEIQEMRFYVRELGTWVEGGGDLRPAVVITSNSEKSLPEPFLRRCVFHHIDSPDDKRRKVIIEMRNHPFARRGLLYDGAMAYFEEVHGNLGRAPGTAELLAWLTALENSVASAARSGAPTPSLRHMIEPTIGIFAKTDDDIASAKQLIPG